MKNIIRYGLYPFLLIAVIGTIFLTLHFQWEIKTIAAIVPSVLLVSMIILETVFPMSNEWKMTKQSFFRDLKYMITGIATITLTRAGFSVLAIYYAENFKGLFANVPLLISVVGYLLVFEFIQYWFHRYNHEGTGKIGKFLGNVHLAHHLPDKVYILMHAVFHPINAFITVIILQLPLIILGLSPEAVFAANLIIGLHSLVSHFNVDIRAGFLNYVFIGTELHRNHHSANLVEAKNYGSTLAIWDIIFGTFYYKPDSAPNKLGIENPNEFPQSNQLWQVLIFPFRGKKVFEQL